MDRIRVNVGKGYDINIGEGIIAQAGELLSSVKHHGCRAMVITDSNVAKLYLSDCINSIAKAGFDTDSIVFEAGEETKNIATLENILESMAEKGMTRSDIVIALGGGVTGDMAGFAAGIYMRGLPFIQMPTTLLAAVDSSVGGKTAIDLKSGKNLAGLFHQPDMVICDTSTLTTLPDEEYRCGLAEAIKTGVLADEKLFEIFESDNTADMLRQIIVSCAEYKAGVVRRDEREMGERKLLNLGHTVGHAIEKLSNFEIKHGFAVAAGLGIIARASAKLGWSDYNTAKRIESVLAKNGLPTNTDIDASPLAKAAFADKKRLGKTITIVVPAAIGACELKEIEIEKLKKIILLGQESL